METYIDTLSIELEKNQNLETAAKQKAYMRNQFEFYGIKTPERRKIQQPFLAPAYLPPKEELFPIIKALWSKPQRDYQLFGQELVFKYLHQLEQEDMELLEYMVIHKSWWDTVDYIAYQLMGFYFKKYPEARIPHVDKWLSSENIWLQRSALLFQLKYKEALDTELLSATIHFLKGSKAFFINKAIGWVLREYSKTNPDWVVMFIEKTELSGLSKREGLRLIGKL